MGKVLSDIKLPPYSFTVNQKTPPSHRNVARSGCINTVGRILL